MNDYRRNDRYWVGFNIVRGIGPTRLRALIDYFGGVEQAWHAPVGELRHVGLDRRSLQNLLETRSARNLLHGRIPPIPTSSVRSTTRRLCFTSRDR